MTKTGLENLIEWIQSIKWCKGEAEQATLFIVDKARSLLAEEKSTPPWICENGEDKRTCPKDCYSCNLTPVDDGLVEELEKLLNKNDSWHGNMIACGDIKTILSRHTKGVNK